MLTDILADPVAAFMRLLLQAPGLLFAVTIHEVAHAVVADRLGDSTAREEGRLTLSPWPHLDPLGALAFILAGFGWARPVPVNVFRLRRPVRDMACVALAGPLSNFVVAFGALVALVLARRAGDLWGTADAVTGVLRWAYQFNLGLGIFNLLPLPPLDGGHFLPYFLPRRAWPLLERVERWGPLALILLVMTGAVGHVLGPAFQTVHGLYVWAVRALLF